MSNECEDCKSTSCSAKGKSEEEQLLMQRMCKIKNKIVILSGKGGVGKSTFATNLAVSLANEGKKVGLLDADIHGPSIPTMITNEVTTVLKGDDGIMPIEKGNLKIMSIGFLLSAEDAPVIYRGPMKLGVIKQFLTDVAWGELDSLIIDTPPGTGDEPLTVLQSIDDITGAVIVTTPQDVAGADVSRSINFCKTLETPIIGIVENMSGFICPGCGDLHHIFGDGGGKKLAEKYKIPFLGEIPIDLKIGKACDDGQPYITDFSNTETGKVFTGILNAINV